MRDYQEVADRVFQRSEEIIAENRRKKRARIKAGSLASCCCLVALLGFGAWQSGVFPQEDLASGEQLVEDGDPGGYSATPGVESSGNEVSEQDPAASSAGDAADSYGFFCITPDNSDFDWGQVKVTRMISSYGDGGTEVCYAAPENGTFGLSIPLSGAIEEYGDTVQYRVFLDLFRDGQALEMNGSLAKEESTRLAALGCGPAVEIYFDGTSYHYYFTLHATMDQVINFAASEEYGYMLFLYNERIPSSTPDSEDIAIYN